MWHYSIGHLQHGRDGIGPFRTEAVTVRRHGIEPGTYVKFESKWRRVRYDIRTDISYIIYQRERIVFQED